MAKPRTVADVRGHTREMQRALKALGMVPPPPDGKERDPAREKRGGYYQVSSLEAWIAYEAKLERALEGEKDKWTADAHLHSVMRAALEAAPEKERPPAPHHDGATARPAFTNLGHLRISRFFADAVDGVVPEKDRSAFNGWVQHARKVSGRDSLRKEQVKELSNAVWRKDGRQYLDEPGSDVPPAVAVAHLAAIVAYWCEVGNPCDATNRHAAARAVEALAGRAGAVRKLLVALDAMILREDLAAALEGREETPVAKALWRGVEKGKTTHWLGVLEDGRHVLTYKLRGKWRVFTGTRDDVLASVPDAHMDSAVRAVMR